MDFVEKAETRGITGAVVQERASLDNNPHVTDAKD